MLSKRAFRAQLVTQGQRDLFDYWQSSAGQRRMPARSDLDPLRVPRLLPNLGLIDLRGGFNDASFRLAGTRLRDIYGQEITGKRVADVFAGDAAAYWRRIHFRVVEWGQPLHGVIRGPVQGRDHIILFWLRLPLSEDGGCVDRILCHDTAGPRENDCAPIERAVIAHRSFQPRSRSELRRAQCG
jgi:hypothetical protein